MNLSKTALNLGVCLALLLPHGTTALPTDRQQPIYIQSDRLKQDRKKGITVYSGAVQMDQGSLRITADKITIHSTDNKMDRIIAKGKPAHFQQKPAEDKNLIIAQGSTIEYLVKHEKIHLVKDATIEQEGTTMKGERIDYNIKEAVVTAVGNPANTENPRIEIVIPPQPQNDEKAGNPTEELTDITAKPSAESPPK